jgi:hypothetical protein
MRYKNQFPAVFSSQCQINGETKLSIPRAFIVLNLTLVCFLNHLPTSHSDIFSVRTNFTSFQFFYNQGRSGCECFDIRLTYCVCLRVSSWQRDSTHIISQLLKALDHTMDVLSVLRNFFYLICHDSENIKCPIQ